MFCPKCGTTQTLVGRVCIKCNAPLSSATKSDISQPAPLVQHPNQKVNQYPNQLNQQFNQQPNLKPKQNFNPPQQDALQNQGLLYPLQPNQPAPPPWSYQTTEQERQKSVYPSVEMPSPNNGYSPGQYLQPFAQNYQLSNQPYSPQNNTASNRAIWALVFSILSFAFCPIFAAMIGVTLSYQELEAIEKGLAPPAGKSIAQIGYYLSMANMILYTLGIGLLFLITIL